MNKKQQYSMKNVNKKLFMAVMNCFPKDTKFRSVICKMGKNIIDETFYFENTDIPILQINYQNGVHVFILGCLFIGF